MKKNDKICLEIIKELYLYSESSVDYDVMDKSSDTYFLNHSISIAAEQEIIDRILAKYKLPKHQKQMIATTVRMGDSPTYKLK